MPKILRIAPDIALPLDAVTQTFGILGKRGSGKTHTAVILVEEMLKASLQTVILDPVGVWWGLRLDKNGKGSGLPIIIFGGEHADMPITVSDGKVIAEMIVAEQLSALIDLSLIRKWERKQFVVDFAETLFHINRYPIHVVIDEAHQFAPQKPFKGEERMLGAISDLILTGRSKGIGGTLATQRSAKINKDVLSQVEVLVALRTTAPGDRKAIDAWVDEQADAQQAKEMYSSLSGLPTGDSWWWGPGWMGRGLFRTRARERETYDSSKTPKVGARRNKPKHLKPMDLAKLKTRFSDVVEKAKQEDPKALKRTIAQLQNELAVKPKVTTVAAPAKPVKPKIVKVDIPVITPAQMKTLERISARMMEGIKGLGDLSKSITLDANSVTGQIDDLLDKYRKMPAILAAALSTPLFKDRPYLKEVYDKPAKTLPIKSARTTEKSVHPIEGEQKPMGAERKLLQALVGLGEPVSRRELAIVSCQGYSSGTYSGYLSLLRQPGYITSNGDKIQVGPEAPSEPVNALNVSREAVLARWQHKIKSERKLFNVLLENGVSMTRAELAEKADINLSSGTYSGYLSLLRKPGLILKEPGTGNIMLSPYLVKER